MEENLTQEQINKSRIEAAVRLVAPIIIAVLAKFGIDADIDMIVNVAIALFTAASFVWCWYWKNNSYTKAAIVADKVKDTLKEEL